MYDFLNTMYSHYMFPLITKPSRIIPNTATLIDNIFTNCLHNDLQSGLIYSDISDHFPVWCVNNKQIIEYASVNTTPNGRLINNNQLLQFKYKLLNVDWTPVRNTVDANKSYDLFIHILSNLYNECFPIVQRRNSKLKCKSPWITTGILKSIHVKQKKSVSKRKYVKYKNSLTATIRSSKKKYFYNMFHKIKGDMKKTWSNINGLLGKRRQNIPAKMYHENIHLSSPHIISNSFNHYFVNIAENISQDIPTSFHIFHDFMPVDKSFSSLFLTPTSVYELLKIVSSMKSSKASGSDDMAPKVLKDSIHLLVDQLCIISNKSLSQGIIPDRLKVSKIIPVYKKKNPQNLENYRPISLLPFFSKILERVVHKRLYSHLQINDILIPEQFSFQY
ncbi:uncharacterized protein LOC115923957 [Strongylocentrotus purpuratus]|uniref:Uncharacterized protein n=1 Tax=Strongylocentrotus purpuratus TaxID=7668 RepID=A0A7M7NTC4_STRPU|nr:uncharacterized protein LOC115923957 [Strongylocentrotus purpuratus]